MKISATLDTTRHDTLIFCPEKAKLFQTYQLETLEKENNINGSYDEWYEGLSDFRKGIYHRYIKYSLGQKYRYMRTVEPSGEVIDHHIMSYFAPLNFTRKGWGNKELSPVEQILTISRHFQENNIRFIYAALPNKGSIYPEIICADLAKLNGKTINVPQWRKYIRELIASGVEVIDLLPVFMTHRDEARLFSKEHHISAAGAKLTAETVAEYLKFTTKNIDAGYHIEHERNNIFCSDIVNEYETADVYFIVKDGIRSAYWNQDTDASRIAIFGDCNLQSYMSSGAGISANLAHNLCYPVYNAGRHLIFSKNEDSLTAETVRLLKKFDIVIYNAFASASFVRTSTLRRKHPFSFLDWCGIML